MYKQSVNSFLFALSFFALQLSAYASQKKGPDVTTIPQVRHTSPSEGPSVRPSALDLTGYDAFNSSKLVRTKGHYGYQMKDYGALQKHIIDDIRNFPQTRGEPLIYCEMAAGYGWFPVYIFQQKIRPIRFIVNDLIPENLGDLLKILMSADKEVRDSFKIRPGDCMKLMNTPDFQTLAPQGAHSLSALNVIHSMSPLDTVDFFASVSEKLQPGGKFNVMYDADRPYTLPLPFQNLVEDLTEYVFRNCPSAFSKVQECLTQNPKIKFAVAQYQREFFKKELKKNGFVFPSYLSKESTSQFNIEPVDEFQPSSDFINDLATAVGLRQEKSGGISRSDDGNCRDCQPADASSLWFIFVKDATNSLNTPGEGHFRYSARFKKIRQDAELADQQRKGLKFMRQMWDPFAQKIPLSWRFNNMLLKLNMMLVAAEFDQPNIDLSALWSLPSLTDLKFSQSKQETCDISSAVKRIPLPKLESKFPSKAKI